MDLLLEKFLNELDKYLDDIGKNISLLVLGGNALIIYGSKRGTEDIDLCVEGKDVDVYDWALKYRKTTGVKVDTFVDGWFKTLRMPDFLSRGFPVKNIKLRNIAVYLMNIYDIVLTKIDRWEIGDQEDIELILKKMKLKRKEFEERFQFCLINFNGDNKDKKKFRDNYNEFLILFGKKLK